MDEEQIEELLRAGKIGPEEAERLRHAFLESEAARVPLCGPRPHRSWRLIFLVALGAVLAILTFLAGRALSPRRVSLVRNGGFEEGKGDPSPWVSQNLSGDARFEVVDGDAREGRRFGRIRKVGGRQFPLNSWIQDLGPVPASRRVAVSLWVRTRETPGGSVDLQFYGPRGEVKERRTRIPAVAIAWTLIEREVRVPAGAETFSISLEMQGTGEMDVDDVRVEAIPEFRFRPGEELLTDGAFEEPEGGPLAAWQVPRPPDGIRYAIEPKAGGGHCATITSTVPVEHFATVAWFQTTERFPTGVDLTLGASVRASGSGIANVELEALGADRRPVHFARLIGPDRQLDTLEWRHYETTVSIPHAAEFVTIRCSLNGTGIASFDDISLRYPSIAAPPRR